MSFDAAASARRTLRAIVWLGTFGALCNVAVAGPGNANGNGNGNGNGNADTLELAVAVRDFLPSHPDFNVVPAAGYGQYMWNVATEPDLFGRPVYTGGGFKVMQQAHDLAGRDISWTLVDPAQGDTPAVPGAADGGGVTSASTFNQWFRDIPGLNMSMIVTVSGPLRTQGPFAGMYEINIPQFYPIDGLLLGNDGAHNNYFTCEIVAQFVYDASANYQLYFKTDDDAWVFLDDMLVADLGGINGSPEQWIALARPSLGLQDGQTYTFRFYKADRCNASSRLHLVTNIPLVSITSPSVLAMFD